MGLDQYAFVTPAVQGNTDFSVLNPKAVTLIAKWRKHPNLEGWMSNLYNAKMKAQGKVGVNEKEYWSRSQTRMEFTAVDKDGKKINVDSDQELQDMQTKIQEALKNATDKVEELFPEVDEDYYVFNNQMLRLTLSDLEQLKTAIMRDELPPTTGFFFGDNSDEKYKEMTLEFIDKAQKVIKMGYAVYYESSW